MGGNPGANPPNQSRLIPGAPTLPNMMPAGNAYGTIGMSNNYAGPSLLGREVPPAPVSPSTTALHPGGHASLSLGGALRQESFAASPVVPIPAGRNIASLRAPRGTNFIRLAFAAMFLLGFLGLVGFMLKDYLPDFFPTLFHHGDIVEVSKQDAGISKTTPAPVLSHPAPEGVPLLSNNENAKSASTLLSPPSLAEAPTKTAPITAGFDPTEPAPSKVEEIASAGSSAKPVTQGVAVDSAPKMPANSDTLLEVPATPANNAASPAPVTSTPTSLAQTQAMEEDDAPPEAKPAIAALKQFLSATSLPERLQHTLGADLMKPLMERYYTRSAGGPVVVDHIQFVRMDPNPELGSGRHCIFNLENKTWEFPVPVMLEEQADGFKVDWLAFVEFKDRLLEKFFKTYQDGPARFHVGIIRHHFFEDGVPNLDRKDAFRVMPAPPNSFQASVFLDKDAALAQELRSRLPWETHVWAVVELEWKKLGSQQWVELSAVPQMHWYSLPMAPRPISTSQKAPEGEELPPGISKNGVSGKSGSASNGNTPPPGIRKSSPDLPSTIKRPLPVGR